MKYGAAVIALALAGLVAGASAPAAEIEEGDQPTLDQLKTVLMTGSIRGREAAAERLAALRTPEATAVLIDGFADSMAAYLAADALEKAVKTNSEGMTALLIPGLAHKDFRARMLTAYMVGLCRDAAGSVPLSKLLKDDNYNVRMYAAEALRTSGDKNAVPALVEALKDSYPLVRMHAAAALGVIKDASAVPGLTAALEDSAAAINAAAALGAIGGAEAETGLLKRIRDPQRGVAWAAIEALGACGRNPETAAALKTLAVSAADARTKKECVTAIAAILGRASPAVSERTRRAGQ